VSSSASTAVTGFAAWWQAIRRDRKATIGAIILAFFLLVAGVGPWLVGDPDALVGIPLQPPATSHWLGTTGQGQDVLAQLVAGTRVSLAIGFGVGLTVVLVGALVGVTAGYLGGRVDALLSLLFNVFLVIPGLPLAIVIAAYLPSGPLTLGFVLVVTGWAWNARVVRAQTLAQRKRDFVAAAVVAGESSFRIVTHEILPTMLYWAQNDSALLTGAWWTFAPTGLCVALVGFGLTMLNSGFDEITNPRLQLERAWRAHLRRRGQEPTRSTPVVMDVG
jgi:peptide/nickel transport system permease protein